MTEERDGHGALAALTRTGGRRDLRMFPVAIAAWAAAMIVTLCPASASTAALAGGALAGGAALVPAVAPWVARVLGGVRPGCAQRFRARRLPVSVLRWLGLTVVCAAVVAGVATIVWTGLPSREAARSWSDRAVTAELRITSMPALGADGRTWADAETVRLGAQGERHEVRVPVRVGMRSDDGRTRIAPGSELRIDARTVDADEGEKAVLVLFADGTPEVLSGGPPVARIAADVREAFVSRAERLPAPGAGLLPGLAVGDTRLVGEELDTAMVASGLSHLTAVSGSNCALVTAAGFWAVAFAGGGRRTRVLLAGVMLSAFVVLVTPEPSVVRAATMAGLAMLCLLLGRPRAGLPVLLLAVTVLLVLDPWLSTSPGFALSATATAGLILLAPPLVRGLERWIPAPLATVIAVPLSAQLVCAPIIALFADRQSLVGVVANLLAAPAAPVATVLGLLACLALPLPPVADLLAATTWLPSAWIAATAQTTASMPFATVGVGAGVPAALIMAVLGTAMVRVIVPRVPRSDGAGAFSARRAVGARVVGIASGAIVAIAVGLGIGQVAVEGPIGWLSRPQDWAVAACDVGQGDAVLVRSAGQVMLVDTGPEPEALRACLDRLHVDRLDLLVLTHFDLDHVGAARILVGRVGTVMHGPPTGTADERLIRTLHDGGARVLAAEAGQQDALGDARWRVLWPKPGERAFAPGNDQSVVLTVEGGGVPSSIFLGDLSASAQAALGRRARLSETAVVKVSHHGSADQDPGFYERLAPSLAVVSSGKDNSYGHPRAETLALLERLGARTIRTDESGMTLVSAANGALRVWTERSP